ncbi:unnamed protein product [Ixodes pacificus]
MLGNNSNYRQPSSVGPCQTKCLWSRCMSQVDGLCQSLGVLLLYMVRSRLVMPVVAFGG